MTREEKMKIVINNYFKTECSVNTSIREAFEKGFRIGVKKASSAQPKQQHGRVFQGIVVEYPSYNTYTEYEGKPYFSIKYTENGQEFIGYGTYNPEVLSEWLKEYFMLSAQLETITCNQCVYYQQNHHYCEFLDTEFSPSDFCSQAERREK